MTRQRWQLFARPSLAPPLLPWRPIPGASGDSPDTEWDLSALPAMVDGLGWFERYGTDYPEPVVRTSDLDVLTAPMLVEVDAMGRIYRHVGTPDVTRAGVYTITRSLAYSRTSAISPPRALRRLGEERVCRWARVIASLTHGGDE